MFCLEEKSKTSDSIDSPTQVNKSRKRQRRSILQRHATAKVRKLRDPLEASFKEKVDDAIQRLTNVSIKYCTYGKSENAPVFAISIKKNSKRVLFPLYANEWTDSLIKDLKQAPFGRGTETVVDTTVRNSLQMNPKEFQILNKEWNSHVTKVIVPRIKHDLKLDVTVKATLHKLLVYQPGAFFKSHRDSEKESGMFGTLVVQLPSRYEGGEFIIRHNGKTESMDFSVKADSQNEFSVFYTAFYCDCEHEILPVTSGYRVCLIYNLIATNRNPNNVIPSIAEIDQNSTELDKFKELLKQWPSPQKLVYCLSHKYSAKNLSFDKLKTTDKMVAKFLKNIAEECSLEIMIGTLDKGISGTINYIGENIDSSDSDMCQKGYVINNMKSFCGKNVSMFNSLAVNFKLEVVQEDCFDNVKAFNSRREDTGNEGIEVEYSYRCAAIIFFRLEDILPVLKRGKTNFKIVEDMFLKFFNECKESTLDQKTKDKLFNWAKEVAALEYNSYQSDNPQIYEAIASFESVELFKIYLAHQKLNDDFVPVVLELCKKFGWSSFSTELTTMLDKLHDKDKAINHYQQLIGEEIDDADKLKTMQQILQHLLSTKFINSKLLVKYWLIAKKIKFNIYEFSKSQLIEQMVPVLIQLAQNHSDVIDDMWTKTAEWFLTKLEESTKKKLPTPTWSRVIPLQCPCRDCEVIRQFFNKEDSSELRIEMTVNGRNHMMERVTTIPGWHSFARISEGPPNVLTVTKYRKVNEVEFEKQQSLIRILLQLRSLMPKHEEELKHSVACESSVKPQMSVACESSVKSEMSVKK